MKTERDQLEDAKELLRKALAENTAQRRVIRDITRDNDTAEAIRQEIFQLAAHTPSPPLWVSGRGVKNGHRGGPVLMVSDIHHGEVIDEDQTGGVNKFNATISKQRLRRLTDTTIDLSTNHMGRANVAYPGIVVCFGGDMIGGDIHEELQWSNDRTPQQAVNDLTDELAAMLEKLAGVFGRVFVPCVVGNHGRSTKKLTMKGRVFHNYDWTIYCNLERHFRKDKRIQFMIPSEADAYFQVYGTRFLLTHGDSLGVKGGDGIIGALGPVARGVVKVGTSERQIGRDFDYMLMCHYHQLLWLPNVIVNGCVKGYDEYARLGLRVPYSPPAQALFFVHPEHGITARWPVYLEPRRVSAQSKVWVSWQQ